MAAVVGVVASVLLVLSLFDTLTRLRSIEMRTAIEEFLADQPGSGLGLDADSVAELLRGLVFLNGAVAAVAAVLAVYVAQRHRVARIGFTVAAGVLLLTSPVTGGALALLVAFAAMLLWGRPARDWFAGRRPEPAGGEGASRAGVRQEPWPPPREPSREQWPPPREPSREQWPPPPRPEPSAPAHDPASGSRERPAAAAYPFGQRPGTVSAPAGSAPAGSAPDGSAPGWSPPAANPPASTGAHAAAWPATAADPTRRPASVLAAAVLTFVSAGLVLLVFALMVAGMLLAKDTVLDTIERTPELSGTDLSARDLLSVLWVMSAVCIFWCLAAMALGVLLLQRVRWARALLLVSAVTAAILGILGFPLGLVVTLAAGATAWLLLRPATNAWLAADGADWPGGPPYPPGSGGTRPPTGTPWSGQRPADPPGRPPHGDAEGPAPDQQPTARPDGKPPVW